MWTFMPSLTLTDGRVYRLIRISIATYGSWLNQDLECDDQALKEVEGPFNLFVSHV